MFHTDGLGADRQCAFLLPAAADPTKHRRRKAFVPESLSWLLPVSRSPFGALSISKFRISRSIAQIELPLIGISRSSPTGCFLSSMEETNQESARQEKTPFLVQVQESSCA